MSELQFGDKVEIVEGKYKGSVGIIKNIWTVINVQVDFIGGRKTVPVENIQHSDKSPTPLLAKVESEFEEEVKISGE